MKEFPKSCLPTKFNQRFGKTQKCLFEELDLNLCEENAKMITFHTSENRLRPWIKALSVFYFDNLGKWATYEVRWAESSKNWTDPNHANNSITIDLYKILS
jgi:hypothetical protein